MRTCLKPAFVPNGSELHHEHVLPGMHTVLPLARALRVTYSLFFSVLLRRLYSRRDAASSRSSSHPPLHRRPHPPPSALQIHHVLPTRCATDDAIDLDARIPTVSRTSDSRAAPAEPTWIDGEEHAWRLNRHGSEWMSNGAAIGGPCVASSSAFDRLASRVCSLHPPSVSDHPMLTRFDRRCCCSVCRWLSAEAAPAKQTTLTGPAVNLRFVSSSETIIAKPVYMVTIPAVSGVMGVLGDHAPTIGQTTQRNAACPHAENEIKTHEPMPMHVAARRRAARMTLRCC
jgi:hypothetical protein